MRLQLAVLLILSAMAAQAAQIKGKVTSAVGGEPLARVEVLVLENKLVTVTSVTGEFAIPNLPSGNYTLRLNAVGYHLLSVPFITPTVGLAFQF